MKLIFSRKGFDSQYGGMPSPIINGNLRSLPIPDQSGTLTYRNLGLESLVSDLSERRINGGHQCHNDPDLVRGIFGQAGAAQRHLNNQAVGHGDLLLFFVTFRHITRKQNRFIWRKNMKPKHQLFGWLFIDKAVKNLTEPMASEKLPKNFSSHDHPTGKWPSKNTIYTAPETASLFGKKYVRGSGRFYDTPQTTLTHPGSDLKSFWEIPAWLNPTFDGCGLTCHTKEQFSELGLKTTAKGQEFLAHPNGDKRFQNWLLTLFSTSSVIE